MRFPSLVACTILSISLFLLAQHSSSGSSGGHSSGFSGGASHSSPSSSAGSHSSVRPASPSSGTLSHGSDGRTLGPAGNVQQEKRSALSFLRHPWRRPEPKPLPNVVVLRGPACKHQPCVLPCPRGTSPNGKGGCVVPLQDWCPAGAIWTGAGSGMFSQFRLFDCSGLALAVERQAQLAQQLAGERETACARDPMDPGCTDLAVRSQSEADRYRMLQRQYDWCRARGLFPFADGYYPLGGYYQLGNLFNAYLGAFPDE